MAIVEAKTIKKTYLQGKVKVEALRGVNLIVDKAEFVALAGPSGSGKTTLLNIIGGLDLPDSGNVIVGNNDFAKMNPSGLASLRLHKIGFVFQAFNLIPVLSAIENVEYVMLLQGVPKTERYDRAKAILDDVGLEKKYDRRPAELSGGQQQRVAVARAIVSGPAIVLADEPTANLDSKTGDEVEQLFVYLWKKGNTVVVVTHDEGIAKRAHRTIYLKDGEVIKDVKQ